MAKKAATSPPPDAPSGSTAPTAAPVQSPEERIAALVRGDGASTAPAPPLNDNGPDGAPAAPEAPTAPANDNNGDRAPRRRRRQRREDAASAGDEEAEAPRPKRRRASNSDVVGEIVEGASFWHGPDCTGYATIEMDGHAEHWPVESKAFDRFLSARLLAVTGAVPASGTRRDVASICDVEAQRGPGHAVHRRVANLDDGVIYVDLCDASWRAIEVTALGWQVVERPPVKFVRSPGMLALPEPEPSDVGLRELRGLTNAATDADFTLMVAWLVGALSGRGPFPIGILSGEAGTGKSRLATVMRALVDPSVAMVRAAPKDLRDLFATASNEFVLVLDNVSSMPHELSDELCRIASGAASSARALHTNVEQVFLTGARPIILNGIGGHFGQQADLMSRAMPIRLAPIPEAARRTEREMDAAFRTARPRILAALLDAVSAALRHLPTTTLAALPRMADFALFMTAAEVGLGWEPGTFVEAMEAGRAEAEGAAFEADPVAKAIVDFVTSEHPYGGWEGTPTALLAALNERVPEQVRRSRIWPMTSHSMGTRIDRAAPLLRARGFTIERRHGRERTVAIVPPPPAT
jgi:hypothetical protein